MTTTRQHVNLRWNSDARSVGDDKPDVWVAYAWITGSDHPTPFLWVGEDGHPGYKTEREAYDALRVELLRYYRGRGVRSDDGDTIKNDRGDLLKPAA